VCADKNRSKRRRKNESLPDTIFQKNARLLIAKGISRNFREVKINGIEIAVSENERRLEK
jgi:hypothetical protein